MKLIIHALSIYFFLAITTFSFGQDSGIEADRPDQTETPAIVPHKHFQMETGFAFESDGVQKVIVHPAALMKYGVLDNFELRLIVESLTFKTTNNGESSNSGILPLQVGMKIMLFEEKKARPAASLIGHVGIPWASTEANKLEYFPFNFRFTVQHTLAEWISLGYNVGMEWTGISPEPIFIYTIVTGFSLNELFGAFIEGFGFIPQKSNSDHAIDGGFIYLPRPNLMVDISGGWNFNFEAYFVGCGFSFRLPD